MRAMLLLLLAGASPGPAPAPKTAVAPDAIAADPVLAAKAAAFVDAFIEYGADFTPDGQRVVFISNRDGLPQLYVGDPAKPDEAPARVLATTERVGAVQAMNDGKTLLFTSDVGADEHWSIFRIGLDGRHLVDLTPGERLYRDPPILPDGRPDTMFFSARRMSDPKSTLYSASTATPGPAKAVYTDELPMFATAVSADGSRALVTQFPATGENYVLLIDVASGRADRLFPRSGKVAISTSDFSPDGRTVYVGTDNGAEQSTLLAIDRETREVKARNDFVPASAEISGTSVSRRTGEIAVVLTVGSYSEIRVLDGKSLAQKFVAKLPLGQAGGAPDWSDDGRRLVVPWSTPSLPRTLFAIEAATGEASPLRTGPRPTLKGMPEIESRVVGIPAFDGGEIPTNVYFAKGEQGRRHPTLVVYHGGPSGVSMIRWSPATAFFVSLGYAVVEPNVRGSSGYGRAFEAADNGAKRLDAFRDIEASARWVAEQPWADRDRLVAFGASYGGYSTLIALSRWPDLWRAGVNLFGVVNLKSFMETTSGVIRTILLSEFGDPATDGEFLARISPITDVSRIVDPTFVYAGANDPRVPRSESDSLVEALRRRGIPSEYMVAENEGHSLARRATQIEFYARCAYFLKTALR
jgi:dipeptidyl aminopeptidase/acylaminoacyl peptidase